MTSLKRSGWMGAVLLPTLLALWLPTQVKAAPQTYAVVVGISDYTDPQIKDRPNAEKDATAFYDLFTSEKYLGAGKDHVKLLLGKKDENRPCELATKDNIIAAVEAMAKNASQEDLVFVVFIGQGISLGESGKRTAYLAVDSKVKDRAETAVPATAFGAAIEKLKSDQLCVFLDINFKGFDAGKESIPEANLGDNPYQEFLGDDGSLDHTPKDGRVLFLATNGLISSPDLKDHGLFTHTVIEGLKGAADKVGYEADGLVTVNELKEYVDKEIPELRREHKLIEKDPRKRLDHFVLTGPAIRYPLTRNPEKYGQAQERLKKFEELAKTTAMEDILKEEGQRYLKMMPKLEAQRKLRQDYQQLVDGKMTLAELRQSRDKILASLRLPVSEATKFAAVVIDAINRIDEDYYKKIDKAEMTVWAIRGIYRSLDEPVPEDIEKRLVKADNMGVRDLFLLTRDVRQKLGKREDLDEHKDINVALQRMLRHLDPYTTYIDPDTIKRFTTEVEGDFTGIGVQIRKDATTDMLQVVTPIKDSPSYKAGLRVGDLIETVYRDVDSEGNPISPTEVLHTKDMDLSDIVKKILGKEGTKVKLKVLREGVKAPFYVDITRAKIEVESVFGVKRKNDDTWSFMLDPTTKIGYIRLGNFARNTFADLKDAISQLRKQGMRGLVLDLRFNPGGLLTAAWQISDLFVDDGKIVEIRPRVGRSREFPGTSEGSLLSKDFEMTVLVNEGSASASEIVSACLQDYKRAVVVGERSFGKGSVQNIQPFEDGLLKLTTATFWRPSGKNLNKSSTKGTDDEDWGVRPDAGYEVKLTRKEREDLAEYQRNTEIIQPKDGKPVKVDDFKDRQLEAAMKYLRNRITGATRK